MADEPMSVDTATGGIKAGAVGGDGKQNIRLRVDGAYYAQASVDKALAIRAFPITGVKMLRGTAGDSGTTTVDIHKNGTTIFTTQGNRPSAAYTDGDDHVDSATPDVTSVAANDVFTLDIDAAEAGGAADIIVEIYE